MIPYVLFDCARNWCYCNSRLSGPRRYQSAIYFKSPKANFTVEQFETHTAHFGNFSTENEVIDEVVLYIIQAPAIRIQVMILWDISCHGSEYIQQRILEVLIDADARMARAGEFTQRAFLNGRLDLSQEL